MEAIQTMLEALKDAEDYLIGSRLCAPLLNTVTDAIAAGEAELRMTQELIERLGHTDELCGDSVWEVREALKKQANANSALAAERDNLIAQRTAETTEFARLVDHCKAERDTYIELWRKALIERNEYQRAADKMAGEHKDRKPPA